jgi:membrane protein DedA with SNARE-associated domain
MDHFLDTILNFITPQSDAFLYFFLFLSAIIENLVPPIPGDTITAFGAFLVGTGRLHYALVYISTTLGSVIGFMILYYIARFLDKEIIFRKNIKFFKKEAILAAEQKFQKFGYFIVLTNRFFPGIRSVISLTSGILKLNSYIVWLFSFLSASIWNLIWIQAGYSLGNNWETVKQRLKIIFSQYTKISIIVFVILAGIFFIYKIYRLKKNKNSPN